MKGPVGAPKALVPILAFDLVTLSSYFCTLTPPKKDGQKRFTPFGYLRRVSLGLTVED